MGRFKELGMELGSEPLAIWPQRLHEMMLLARSPSDSQRAEHEARRTRNKATAGKVVVMSLFGFIARRANIVTDFFGGTAMDEFGRALDSFVADSTVKTIVFDVDSPGGIAEGNHELAEKVRAARDQKRIIAVADTLMASAAYYIGSAATEVVASPSSWVGSIGTVYFHEDWSKALEAEGVDVTAFVSSVYKAEGNPYEPLTDEASAQIQKEVDQLGDQFERDVAKNRGITPARVKASYGQGRAFIAAEAKQRGLVDRVASLDQVLDGLGVGPAQASGRYAGEAEILRRRAAVRERGWKQEVV